VAADRFLDNPDIGVQEIVAGHPPATRARRRTQEVVLLGQDPPLLNYGPTPPKAGRGPGKLKQRDAWRLPAPVAVPPARVNGGGVGMKGWQRPDPPVARQRKRKPLEEQERSPWLAG
jgi:hypothetical protein